MLRRICTIRERIAQAVNTQTFQRGPSSAYNSASGLPMLPWRLRDVLALGTTVVILVTCGLLLWANRDSDPGLEPAMEAVSIAGAASKGAPDAPVAIVMWTDYQCPFCARFEQETLPQIERRYIETGKVLLVVRHHPLERIHPIAFQAALAATCADRQDRFWEVHKSLFDRQETLEASLVHEIGTETPGLDSEAFSACLDDSQTTATVQKDVDLAIQAGLSGTPAFLIGRRTGDGSVAVSAVLTGAQPMAEFAEAIERAARMSPSNGWLAVSLVSLASLGLAVMTRQRWVKARRTNASGLRPEGNTLETGGAR